MLMHDLSCRASGDFHDDCQCVANANHGVRDDGVTDRATFRKTSAENMSRLGNVNSKSADWAPYLVLERNAMSMRLSACFAFSAAVLGLALTATTPAHAYVEAGSLNCRSPGPAGFLVVSARVFDCVFAPASGAPPQYYRGTVSRFGAQIGFTNDVALGWIVLAATSGLGPGALAG